MANELIEALSIFGDMPIEAAALVGSRRTVYPAPADTDSDILVLVQDRQMQNAIGAITKSGFDLDTGGAHYRPENGTFNSWRKGELNLIVTASYDFFAKFMTASTIAKRDNLTEKADRITLFQKVLYGRETQQNGWGEDEAALTPHAL